MSPIPTPVATPPVSILTAGEKHTPANNCRPATNAFPVAFLSEVESFIEFAKVNPLPIDSVSVVL